MKYFRLISLLIVVVSCVNPTPKSKFTRFVLEKTKNMRRIDTGALTANTYYCSSKTSDTITDLLFYKRDTGYYYLVKYLNGDYLPKTIIIGNDANFHVDSSWRSNGTTLWSTTKLLDTLYKNALPLYEQRIYYANNQTRLLEYYVEACALKDSGYIDDCMFGGRTMSVNNSYSYDSLGKLLSIKPNDVISVFHFDAYIKDLAKCIKKSKKDNK